MRKNSSYRKTRIAPARLAAAAVLVFTAVTQIHARPSDSQRPLKAVKKVDVNRYMGSWYEIARYPNRYQEGHVAVVATYKNLGEGRLGVVNTGRLKTISGPKEASTARAWLVEGSQGAKWKVQFFWPFEADYWIIDLCDDYQYAVVGQPSRDNLWILCRKPKMDADTYKQICERLRTQGYDPSRLQKTPHPTKG